MARAGGWPLSSALQFAVASVLELRPVGEGVILHLLYVCLQLRWHTLRWLGATQTCPRRLPGSACAVHRVPVLERHSPLEGAPGGEHREEPE